MVKLYLQPNIGMCWVANAVSSEPSQCYTWENSQFWKLWQTENGTGSDTTDAVAAAPKVYSFAVALIFFALIPSCLIVFHYFKPEILSTFMMQLLTSLFMALVFVFSCIDPAKANGSILCDVSNWKAFYIKVGLTCEDDSGRMYIGGGLTVVNVFLSFFAFILATIPGIALKSLTDGGYTSSNNTNEGKTGGGNGDGDTIKDSLVSGDSAESQYVPPSI